MVVKKMVNPFKPTAGAEPPVLAGRRRVIDDFIDGLDEGIGAPGRLMRITGPRGSGKTVLLTELGDIARKRGWLVVDETAREGLIDRLIAAVSPRKSRANVSADFDFGVVKAHAGLGGETASLTLREALSAALSHPGECGEGIFITLDEVQDAQRSEISEIATTVQHLIRERKNIAFAFAGITTGVMDLIDDSALTFLRRAKAEELAAIPVADVAEALSKSFDLTGLRIEGRALERAAEASRGYAFLVQLVGYSVWRNVRAHADESHNASIEDVDLGVSDAMAQFDETVILPALSKLPKRCMTYLVEMSKNDGACSTGDIARAMGIAASSLTSARRTLISRQVIESTARGYVDFSIPLMREYVRDNEDELMSRFG